jgi:2-methylcitrate dehydratase PrpD
MGLRDRVSTVVDSSIKEDQVRVTITLKDGRRLEKFVEHAVGSVDHPMSDADLEAKFMGLADGVLPRDQVRRLIDMCWKMEAASSSAALARAAALGG